MNNKQILLKRMMSACDNILYAMSGLDTPEDIARDNQAIENMKMGMTIINECHRDINPKKEDGSQDVVETLPNIHWDEIKEFEQVLKDAQKSIYDYCGRINWYKTKIPFLKEKLAAELQNA